MAVGTLLSLACRYWFGCGCTNHSQQAGTGNLSPSKTIPPYGWPSLDIGWSFPSANVAGTLHLVARNSDVACPPRTPRFEFGEKLISVKRSPAPRPLCSSSKLETSLVFGSLFPFLPLSGEGHFSFLFSKGGRGNNCATVDHRSDVDSAPVNVWGSQASWTPPTKMLGKIGNLCAFFDWTGGSCTSSCT